MLCSHRKRDRFCTKATEPRSSYRTAVAAHTLHFDALRLVALREGDGVEEALATENERKRLYAHLRTYTQPTQLFAAGTQLVAHSQPACELASWPLLGVLLSVFGE